MRKLRPVELKPGPEPTLPDSQARLFILFYGLGLPSQALVDMGPERGGDRLKITQQILRVSTAPEGFPCHSNRLWDDSVPGGVQVREGCSLWSC